MSSKQKFGRERSYSFAPFHTVSPGEGIKCCRLDQQHGEAQLQPIGLDGTGATGLPLSMVLGSRRTALQIEHFAFPFLWWPVSCAKRYGYPLSCPFVQQKQKLIKVNVWGCCERSSGLPKLGRGTFRGWMTMQMKCCGSRVSSHVCRLFSY